MEDEKVEKLLTRNGFDDYIAAFREHAIRSDVLYDLTSEDLRDIGVSSLGHRVQILRLIDSQRPTYVKHSGLSQRSEFTASSSSVSSASPATLSGSAPVTPSTEVEDASTLQRENLLLKQRVENSEKHIRKLSEQVARLRADLFRKFKESEPLPTPTGRSQSPASTPNTGVPHLSKRLHSDGYFSRGAPSSAGSASVSPNRPRPNSVHVFHGHYQPASSNSGTGSHTQSPSVQHFPSSNSSSSHALNSANNANLVITAPSEPFKNFRCGEKDNVAKVLSALLRQKYLDGDISQWRLQIEYGDKARELLDHEYPLVIFKQLQDQGHSPVFTMKPIQPHKPPPGGSYI